MARTFNPARHGSCLHVVLSDQCKAALGTVFWFAGLHLSEPGSTGLLAVSILCVAVHLLWSIGSCIDGARLIASAGTAAVTVGALVLITKGVISDVAPPLAALGALMHMSPSWSQPATLYARVTR